MEQLMDVFTTLNSIFWGEWVLVSALVIGVIFTVFSVFGQYRSLTHGTAAVTGRYASEGGQGAISHFQALSAALSATVGLGNIAGVAIAIMVGGPGAILWMWVVGVLGMAIKSTEVTLSMVYRNVDDPDNPQGGPMWVLKKAVHEVMPNRAGRWLGLGLGGLFCFALIVSALTGGNLFQAFNVANVSFAVASEFGVTSKAAVNWTVGIVLTLLVAAVILGGIKRIGAVAGTIVPFMCGIYVLCGLVIIALHVTDLPMLFGLIIDSALNEQSAVNAFVGGTTGAAFSYGMQRAIFSSEAGFGSAPIVHCAVKTNEPVREGVVAGLEPFIDTLVVCTITALVILISGVWNRAPDFPEIPTPASISSPAQVTLEPIVFESTDDYPDLRADLTVYARLESSVADAEPESLFVRGSVVNTPSGRMLQWQPITDLSENAKITLANDNLLLNAQPAASEIAESPELKLQHHKSAAWQLPPVYLSAAKLNGADQLPAIDTNVFWVASDGSIEKRPVKDHWPGKVLQAEQGAVIVWERFAFDDADVQPILELGLYRELVGASATRFAFNELLPGVGGWMVSLAVLLFALSTMISWSYYGEQGVIFLTGGHTDGIAKGFIIGYKLLFCAVVLWSCVGLDPDNKELNALSNVGLGLMLTMNIPILFLFGMTAITHYHRYIQRLKQGEFKLSSRQR